MRKFVLLAATLVLLVSVCSCRKRNIDSVSNDSSNVKKEIVVTQGKYYENNDISDDNAYILIDENNMLSLVNYDYEIILNILEKDGYIDCIKDEYWERIKEPCWYDTTLAERGILYFYPIEEIGVGLPIYYNEEDQIISFLSKDYYLEEK